MAFIIIQYNIVLFYFSALLSLFTEFFIHS